MEYAEIGTMHFTVPPPVSSLPHHPRLGQTPSRH